MDGLLVIWGLTKPLPETQLKQNQQMLKVEFSGRNQSSSYKYFFLLFYSLIKNIKAYFILNITVFK